MGLSSNLMVKTLFHLNSVRHLKSSRGSEDLARYWYQVIFKVIPKVWDTSSVTSRTLQIESWGGTHECICAWWKIFLFTSLKERSNWFPWHLVFTLRFLKKIMKKILVQEQWSSSVALRSKLSQLHSPCPQVGFILSHFPFLLQGTLTAFLPLFHWEQEA